MRRREFFKSIGGAAIAWPLGARAQQPALPIVGVVGGVGADTSTRYVTAFRKGLNENGIIEGQNVTVEYHWLKGQYDRLPSLMADLVRRRVAVIAALGSNLRRLPLRPPLRRSRSFSASVKTRSSLVLLRASPGRAATRPASIFSTSRLLPRG
jgi:hypothetical protein